MRQITRRQAVQQLVGAGVGAFVCRLPATSANHAEEFTYRGVNARIAHHDGMAMLYLRRRSSRRWQEMPHAVFMRMDDRTYDSCLYCTGARYRSGTALARRLIRDSSAEAPLFYLV